MVFGGPDPVHIKKKIDPPRWPELHPDSDIWNVGPSEILILSENRQPLGNGGLAARQSYSPTRNSRYPQDPFRKKKSNAKPYQNGQRNSNPPDHSSRFIVENRQDTSAKRELLFASLRLRSIKTPIKILQQLLQFFLDLPRFFPEPLGKHVQLGLQYLEQRNRDG